MSDIDRCMCGGVQGDWSYHREELPLRSKHLFGAHSQIGCFRTGGDFIQLENLFHVITGLWPNGIEYWPLFQSVLTKLKERPDVASTVPVVLTPTPLIPPQAYEIPRRNVGQGRGRVVGGGPVTTSPAKPIPGWDPVTGTVKPPWLK